MKRQISLVISLRKTIRMTRSRRSCHTTHRHLSCSPKIDLFRRKSVETRSSGTGYTAQIMAARQSFITGASGLGELTSAVQSCVTLWEGGLSLADVKGTDLLTRRALAITARAMALPGEAVFLIRDTLIAASDWDVTTRNGDPRSYRLQISEAGGGRSEIALCTSVSVPMP